MTEPIKITVLSCIWQRPRVTRAFLAGLRRLKQNAPEWVELTFVLVYSNYNDLINIKNTIHDFDQFFYLVYAPNRPLGRKHNLGLSCALNGPRFDYIMQLGSDDLLCDEIWPTYRPWMVGERKFFGLNSIYFYDTDSGRIKRYKSTQVFGAGRCIHRSVVAQFVRASGYVQLWTDDKEMGLDRDSEDNLTREIGFANLRVMPVNASIPMVLDIKSDENINSFASIPGKVQWWRNEVNIHNRFPELISYQAEESLYEVDEIGQHRLKDG